MATASLCARRTPHPPGQADAARGALEEPRAEMLERRDAAAHHRLRLAEATRTS
jgi:hypothetical protein